MDQGAFEELIAPYERIVVDVGTGDGLFVYNCARQDPQTFFIGIDANRRPLQKISERIHRRPARGGLPNVLFAQSAVEDLPPELDGRADQLHVNFPWGSLLGAVAGVNAAALDNLRRICRHGASLNVIAGLDPERDTAEIKRLQLPILSAEYMGTTLTSNYRNSGFAVIESGILRASVAASLQTSWAKRLKRNPNRALISIVARAD